MINMVTFENREDWLRSRELRLGGSDAACLLGLNPWKTNVQLWQEKMHPETVKEVDNDAMRYGRKAEPHIRALFALDNPTLEIHYVENNLWLNTDYPFAHASLDGWINDRDETIGVLEIKTVTFRSMMQEWEWNERIPSNYYCQVLWYMMVTGAQYAKLVALMHWEYKSVVPMIKTYDIERKEDEIEVLADAGEKFYESLREGKKPALILPNV